MPELKPEPLMRTTDLLAAPPALDRIESTLAQVAELLAAERCYTFRRSYHFPLGQGWTIAITPESAARFRVEACKWSRPVVRYWTLATDEARLESLVLDIVGGVREGV
jgi:hypothetical protein